MRNITGVAIAGAIAAGTAGGFIFYGDTIVEALARLIPAQTTPAPKPAPDTPPAPTVERAPDTQRVLVYTRALPEDHVIQPGEDVTFDALPVAEVPAGAFRSPGAVTDPALFRQASDRPLEQAVEAGVPVLNAHLGAPVNARPSYMNQPGYKAATDYIARVRELRTQEGIVFLENSQLDAMQMAADLMFDASRTEHGGRLVEGRYTAGTVTLVETDPDLGQREELASDLALQRIAFADSDCPDVRHFIQAPGDVADRVALARALGEPERIQVQLQDAPVETRATTVCSGNACDVSAPGGADGGESEPAAETPGADAPSSDPEPDSSEPASDDAADTPADEEEATTDGPDRLDQAFALGAEAPAPTTGEPPVYCRDGRLIDPATVSESK